MIIILNFVTCGFFQGVSLGFQVIYGVHISVLDVLPLLDSHLHPPLHSVPLYQIGKIHPNLDGRKHATVFLKRFQQFDHLLFRMCGGDHRQRLRSSSQL